MYERERESHGESNSVIMVFDWGQSVHPIHLEMLQRGRSDVLKQEHDCLPEVRHIQNDVIEKR